MKAYIKKISYVLPENVEENPVNRLTKKTGIFKRHICSENEIASELAYSAAKKILADYDKDKIDFLILCTQSPDYYLPTTACILQNKLGLRTSCGALDYNLGCSGYIYGLSMAKALIESNQAYSVLLLTAETYSKYINPKDNTVRPLFGDGASATIIEAVDTDIPGLDGFVFGTDGSGYEKLIVPVGGMQQPYNKTKVEETTDEYGNYRTNHDLYMSGSAISDFALDVVPPTIEDILAKTKLNKNEIDYYVLHQANKFMLKFLQQKCDLLDYPYWNNVEEYGNTVSSSIPIALVDMKKENPEAKTILSVGFGVGLSWAGCVMRLDMVEV